ncbi:MAG: hypothetical protein AAGG50_04405 [Bacteroidota bacterium]
MTTTRPDEVRFYLDDTWRALEGRPAPDSWQKRRSVRLAYGGLGSLLLVLSVYEFVTDGWHTELFVYVNVILGVAFLLTAFNVRAGQWLFGRSPLRPFLAIRPDGVTLQHERKEHQLAWSDLVAIEQQPTSLVLVTAEGLRLPIAFSELSYERVQEVKDTLLDAARDAGVPVR